MHEMKKDSQQKVPNDERIPAHHQATGIPDDLEDETAEHADEHAPGSVEDAKTELSNEEDSEDCEVQDVASQVGLVVEEALAAAACLQGAEVVGEDVVGHSGRMIVGVEAGVYEGRCDKVKYR